MNEQLQRLQSTLMQMAPRERMMVLVGAVVVFVMLVYLMLWEPLVDLHAQRVQSLQNERALAQRIERAAVLTRSASRGRAPVDRNTSLLAAVDSTSRSPTLGKAPSRVQPEGDREVKVWIEDVPFSNLLRWLQELQTRYGIAPGSAEIERGSQPGLVSGRLSLARN